MTSARGIPTSRAYWELKAEQMLNRVFSNETPIEVEIVEPIASSAAEATPQVGPQLANPVEPQPQPQQRQRSAHALAALLQRRPELVPISIATAGVATALITVLVAGLLGSQQQALRQERNLVLLERLRAMGPASGNGTAEPEAPAQANAGDGLPPPPPNEPWMEELAQLPAGGAPPAEVLKVPFTAAIGTRAPSAPPPVPGSGGHGGSDGVPLLVGVVQVPGRSGSAIFQVGGSSTSAAVGESIGGSGWRLRSASGDSAVIERGGQVRRISISSGF
ncbi:MAG: hypothetical protein VKL97_03950 [Cyanobacteriota bacterium]|nr:hypothetical protein [Cyanobacteriota bacterium]